MKVFILSFNKLKLYPAVSNCDKKESYKKKLN